MYGPDRLAFGGVICAMEYEGKIDHNDGLQMRCSKMGDTPECLVPRPFMHGGGG